MAINQTQRWGRGLVSKRSCMSPDLPFKEPDEVHYQREYCERNLLGGKGWLQSWKDILRYLWLSKNAWARLPDTVLRLKGSLGQTWSTVIFKSWAEDLPWGKENEKKQPEQSEKNKNQWEKGIFSRSNWSAVWNHSERSSTGKCPK